MLSLTSCITTSTLETVAQRSCMSMQQAIRVGGTNEMLTGPGTVRRTLEKYVK